MIALYPGAYKPPHKGHFTVVKKLLNGSHNGVAYDIDNYLQAGEKALKGDKRESVKVSKVVIFIGGNTRNGITPEHAETIWNIYKKYLGNIEIVKGEKNPMYASSKYAKANPNEKFYAITGIRDEDDLVDLKRVTTFKNRDNVEGLVVSGDGVDQRASIIRGLTLAGNTRLRNYFPDEISDEEFNKILNIMKTSTVDENINNAIKNTFSSFFSDEVNEDNSGTPIAPRSVMKSADRSHLITLYKRIERQVGSDNVEVEFKNDHIKVSLKDKYNSPNFDYTPFMGSILEYMLDQKMNITPLPEIKIKRDLKEAANFFGRTAYYNPNTKEVVVYTEGRHPKDVMRSFVHEMIHHIQNLEGRLGSIGTTNTNEDDDLVEIEKEAYMLGNITFRNWEDKIKNEGYEK
jgi:nicotinamide mononucleotide adenylyltransferase